MKKYISCLALLAAITLGTTLSSRASIVFTYDNAISTPSTGLYAFDLSGVVGTPTFNSTFVELHFTTIGNPITTTVVSVAAPSGWSFNQDTSDLAKWFFENTSGQVNGLFEVQAAPNLSGTLNWQFANPGSGPASASGTVTIGGTVVPVPETSTVFAGAAMLGLAAVSLRKTISRAS